MSDEELTLAMAELQEVVRCRCDEAYRDRGLKDPQCECDSAEAVKVVASRIKALTEQLAAARQDAKAAEDELEMQEQEACMMENDYIKLEKERDDFADQIANLLPAVNREAVEQRQRAEAAEAKLAKAVEALDDLLEAITAEDRFGDRSLTITGSTANLKWLFDAEDTARASLAEIKGESHE